jgi:hypothetical protein
MNFRRRGALACVALLAALPVAAQEIEPRAYSNAPVGVNFLILGSAWTQGGLAFDPALPVTEPQLDTTSALLAYARVIDLFGLTAKVDAILPFTRLSGSAMLSGAPIEREVEGLADARLRLSMNLLGGPALSLQEFTRYRQDTILGASLQVSAPSGQYDPARLVNIGSKRWSLKPEIGLSQAFGPWTLEGAAAAVLFTDNDDFYGGRTRSQETLWSLQGHAVYNFPSGIWAAADLNYFTGGRTSIDGVEKDDRQENWRAGLTLALPVDRRNSIKFSASRGVSSRTGNDFDLVAIAWQYRWGGGL